MKSRIFLMRGTIMPGMSAEYQSKNIIIIINFFISVCFAIFLTIKFMIFNEWKLYQKGISVRDDSAWPLALPYQCHDEVQPFRQSTLVIQLSLIQSMIPSCWTALVFVLDIWIKRLTSETDAQKCSLSSKRSCEFRFLRFHQDSELSVFLYRVKLPHRSTRTLPCGVTGDTGRRSGSL